MMRLEVHPCVLPDGYAACVVTGDGEAERGVSTEQHSNCPLCAAVKALAHGRRALLEQQRESA